MACQKPLAEARLHLHARQELHFDLAQSLAGLPKNGVEERWFQREMPEPNGAARIWGK